MKHHHLTALLAAFLLGAGLLLALLSLWQQEQIIADGAAVYAELAEMLRTASEPTNAPDTEEAFAAPDVILVPPVVIADVVPIESAESFVEPVAETTAEPTVQPTVSPFFTRADLNTCLNINPDFIGWLSIPGTDIDYPVVLTSDAEFYLTHDFTGQKSVIGCLFSLDRTDYRTSRNIAVYGHHMRRSRSTTMFQPLHEYKSADFCDNHSEIQFGILYGSRKYTVFAVINKRESDWDAAVADFGSAEACQAFLDRAKAWSLYDTGVNVTADDRILTLITCERDCHSAGGQLVVMAVLLVTVFIQQENRTVLEVQFMTGDDEFVLAYADCGIYAITPFFLNKAVDFFFQCDILNETKGMCTFPTVCLVLLRLIGKEFFQ